MGAIAKRCWRIVAWAMGVLCALCGLGSCGVFNSAENITNLYGAPSVKLPIDAASYTPASPVHSGTVLTFSAQLTQGDPRQVEAILHGPTGWQYAPMLDDGVAPDATAQDRVYTGQLAWQPQLGTGEVPVRIYATGMLGYAPASNDINLPTLTVLP